MRPFLTISGLVFFAISTLFFSADLIAQSKYDVSIQPAAFNLKFQKDEKLYLNLEAIEFGRTGNLNFINQYHSYPTIKNEGYVKYDFENLLEIEYFKKPEGLRTNYILNKKPEGNSPLIFHINIKTNLEIQNTNEQVNFFMPDKNDYQVFEYSGFKVWDANNNLIGFSTNIISDIENNDIKIEFIIEDIDAVYPLIIDPLFRSLVLNVINSDDASAQFGSSVALADVNDDGYDDVIGGAPFYDKGITGDGGVFVHLTNLYGISEKPNFKLLSSINDSRLGSKVANAGDINDDGYEDIIAGAPYQYYTDGVYGYNATGAAYIMYGCSYGIDSNNILEILPPLDDLNGNFGSYVNGLGDINGDGYGDVIITSYYYPGIYDGARGRCYLYYGSETGLNPIPVWKYTGILYSGTGRSVGKGGDINGDGFNDFFIGAPYYNYEDTLLHYQGAAYLFYGTATIPDTIPSYTFYGETEHAGMGWSIAGDMDVNNDGFADFTIGNPGEGGEANSCKGMVKNYLGGPTGPVLSWNKTGLFNHSGTTVINAGDFNGDGYSDLLYSSGLSGSVFAPECGTGSEGSALYFGSATGLKSGAAWANRLYEYSYTSYGKSLAGDADFNQDGFDDYIVGIPGFNAPFTGAGGIFIYYGSPNLNYINDVADSSVMLQHTLYESSIYYERDVVLDIDLDNNGYNDVVIGAQTYPGYYQAPGGFGIYLNHGPGLGIETTPSTIVTGIELSQHLGAGVANLGDYNNDGFDDVAVASKDYGVNGAVYIYNGNATGINTTPTIFTYTDNPNVLAFGKKIIAEDFNGDGIKDLVVGDDSYNEIGSRQGAVYVFLGTVDGYQTPPANILKGSVSKEDFGYDIANAGDVNGDGYNDLVVTSTYAYNLYMAPDSWGGIKLFLGSASGLSTTPISNIIGTVDNEYLGDPAYAAGDVNADGFDDILIKDRSTPENFTYEGQIRLYYGSSSGISDNNKWVFKGGQLEAHLGGSFAGPNDINNDGYDDLVVGALGYTGSVDDYNTYTEGGIYIFYGSYTGVKLPSKLIEADTSKEHQKLGRRLFFEPDFTGDGIDEIGALSVNDNEETLEILYFNSAASSCTTIPSLTSSALSNSIYLSWTGNKFDFNYIIKWKSAGDTDWNDTLLLNPEVNFESLVPCTDYLFLIQKNCESGASAWSDTLVVQTSGCIIPCSSIIINGVIISGITESAAHVTWDDSPDAVVYEILFKPTTSVIWDTLINADAIFDISLLSGCTFYDFKIRAICATDSGDYSSIYNFQTLCPACVNAPSYLTISNITTTSAKAKYGAVEGATKYKVWYRATGTTVWKKVTASTVQKVIKNLFPNTTYEIKVQGICGVIGGPFTPVVNFTTLPLKDGEENNFGENELNASIPNNELMLYPNPSNGDFVLAFEQSMNNADYELYIYNSSGQNVYVQAGNILNSLQINSNLSVGVYFIVLQTGGDIYKQKILIMR